jgi:hypothetical protein
MTLPEKGTQKKRSSFGLASAASRGVSLKWFASLDATKMKRLHSQENFSKEDICKVLSGGLTLALNA